MLYKQAEKNSKLLVFLTFLTYLPHKRINTVKMTILSKSNRFNGHLKFTADAANDALLLGNYKVGSIKNRSEADSHETPETKKRTQTSPSLRFDDFFSMKIFASCLFVSDNFLFDFFPILSV